MTEATPIPNAYWVLPGQLLAGEYPGSLDPELRQRRLHQFLQAGVSFFLDLTEEGELIPYKPILQEQAWAIGLPCPPVHRRMPIPDFGVPTIPEMRLILGVIDDALSAGHTVYVHCWGGTGRTGTVVGCYLVQQGLNGAESLQRLSSLRRQTPTAGRDSPETKVQRQMVLRWSQG